MKVLFLGLGRMGLPMAGHAIRKGFEVHGFDPAALRRDALKALGGIPEEEVGQALAAAERIVIMVGQESEVDALFRARDGIFDCARKGAVVLVSSTVSPTFIAGLGAQAAHAGIQLLDAPLCRAEMAAQSGTLLALTSGTSGSHDAAVPLLKSYCSDIFFVGHELGMAQVAKSVNNMILWATVVANYEAFRLAEAWKLDVSTLREVLQTSSANNWSLRQWSKVHEMPWSIKDMDIALRIASEAGLTLPLSNLVKSLVPELPVLRHG